MLGAQIWDVVGRLLRLLQPPDCYPLPLFHEGTNSTARGNDECIKNNCIALGVIAKGGQVVFSSVLLVRRKGLRSSRWILWVTVQ